MDARRRKAFGRKLHGAGFSQACGCCGASEQPHGIVLYRISDTDHNAHFHGNAHAYAELDAHIHGNADVHAHPNPDAHADAHIHRDRYAHADGYRHAYAAAANSHAHGIRDARPDGYPCAHGDAYARAIRDAVGRAHCVPNGCAVLDGNAYAAGNSVTAIRNSAIRETGDAYAAAAYSHDSRADRRGYCADSSHCDCRNAAANHCRAAADCARSGCRYRRNFVR